MILGVIVAWAVLGGLALVAFGLRGRVPEPEPVTPFGVASPAGPLGRVKGLGVPELLAQRVVLAAIGGWLAWTATGWPVLATFAAVFGWVVIDLRLAKKRRIQATERVEAVASFAETLRDLTASGSGLREAVRLSARVAPDAIFAEANELAAGLQRQNPALVLAKFADDLAISEADLVVHSLLVAMGREGGSVSEVLGGAAEGARERAAMLREVEAGRARTSSEAKTVSVISALIVVIVIAVGGDLVDAYDGFVGQVVLAFVLAIFGGAGLKMHSLAKFNPSPRVVSSMAAAVGVVAMAEHSEVVETTEHGVAS